MGSIRPFYATAGTQRKWVALFGAFRIWSLFNGLFTYMERFLVCFVP